jgi:hypothetical protein
MFSAFSVISDDLIWKLFSYSQRFAYLMETFEERFSLDDSPFFICSKSRLPWSLSHETFVKTLFSLNFRIFTEASGDDGEM